MSFRRLIAAAFAGSLLLAAACSPMPATETASTQGDATQIEPPHADPMPPVDPNPTPGQGADAAACAARGGEIRRVGRMQSEQCVILYADAGKVCRDGDDCLGDCRAAEAPLKDRDNASGVCAADSNRFGCITTIENGRAEHTLCVD